MRHNRTPSPAAVLVAVLALAPAEHRYREPYAHLQSMNAEGSIQAEVKGQLSKVRGAGAEHTGLQITANGMVWEVDLSSDKKLLEAADKIAGGVAVVSGTYTESRDAAGLRRVLKARTLEAGTANGRGEYVDVTVRGTLNAGVVAIGGETTGVTIAAGPVTWELRLDRRHLEVAARLTGRTAIVSGQLTQQRGVELRNRSIIDVRSIEAR